MLEIDNIKNILNSNSKIRKKKNFITCRINCIIPLASAWALECLKKKNIKKGGKRRERKGGKEDGYERG